MKATVNERTCIGCGACSDICPEVFELGNDAVAHVRADPVPAEVEAKCRDAAGACPVTAIEVTET
jgi:ferredoxin